MKQDQTLQSCAVLLIACLPLCLGWQTIDLGDYLQELSRVRALAVQPQTVQAQQISPEQILSKVSGTLFKLKSLEVNTEVWLEHDLFHIKSDTRDLIENVDNTKTDGRMSLSLTFPHGFSLSRWVQSFDINGIPFTWDSEEREWKKEELKINGKDAEAILAYGFLQSLFQVKQEEVEPASIRLAGIEKRNGRDCYVLRYTLSQENLKRWKVTGSLAKSLWVDKELFYPHLVRAEGTINGMYFLQMVTFSKPNAAAAITQPAFVADAVKEEKQKLQSKIPDLVNQVAEIRGWKPLEQVPIEFIERVSLRTYLEQEVDRDYTAQELAMHELIFKWLGLIPENVDYREVIINSEIGSVAGLYDPRQHKIFIGNWLHPAVADPVLVHELAHAYQGKTVDRDDFLEKPEIKQSIDATTARHALMEGEAEAVMFEYLLRKDDGSFKSLGDIFEFVEEKILKDSEYTANKIQYNIYGYGANYIHYYLKDNAWAELDKLFAKPPSTMNQILHPYRHYAAKSFTDNGHKIGSLKEPEFPFGWKQVYKNNLGEFYLLISLRQELDKDEAEEASAGWQDDQISVFQNDAGAQVIVLQTKWNSASDAQGYYQAFKKWLSKKYRDLKEDKKEKFAVFQADTKRLFSCSLQDDRVTIIGASTVESGAFGILADAMSES